MRHGSDIWVQFFEATAHRGPRDHLLRLLDFVPHQGTALDFGCGCGHDTVALAKHGLHVRAVDFHEDAIRRTGAAAEAAGLNDRVMLSQATFEDFDFPESYEAIYSGFSLPFCPKDEFENIWRRLRESLKPGGVLAFQLFGDHDGWANLPEYADEVCFHSRAQVERLLEGTERLFDDEVEKDGHTALGEAKYWHVFHLIVRRL